MERGHPIQRTTLCRSRTVGIHPVHTVLADQRHQTLGQFLDRLVEGFRRRMAVLAQHLVLCGENTLNSAHLRAPLAGQVGIYLALERRLEQIARSYADDQRDHAVHRPSRSVLHYGVARVQSPSLEEQSAQRGARALGGDHDYVDVFGRHDARAVRIGGAETVREIERLARGQLFLDRRPYGDLGGGGEQILDNRRELARLLDLEQRLALDPAVGYGLVPCLGVLALADEHVEPVILQGQRLAGALHAVSDDGYRFVFEGFERFAQGEFFARDHVLDD